MLHLCMCAHAHPDSLAHDDFLARTWHPLPATPTTCYQPLYYPSYRVLPTTPTPTYYPYYPYYALRVRTVLYPYYPCYLLLATPSCLLPLGTTPNYPSERFMYRVYVFSMCC